MSKERTAGGTMTADVGREGKPRAPSRGRGVAVGWILAALAGTV